MKFFFSIKDGSSEVYDLVKGKNQVDGGAAGTLYWFYVGFHVVFLVIGGALVYFKKA